MKLELKPEDDYLLRKKSPANPAHGTHISAKPVSVEAAQNPWQGRYNRRNSQRGEEVSVEIPRLMNDRSLNNTHHK